MRLAPRRLGVDSLGVARASTLGVCSELRVAATQRWTVGAATITSVVEDQLDVPTGLLFPEATEADVLRHPWLMPDWADATGNI